MSFTPEIEQNEINRRQNNAKLNKYYVGSKSIATSILHGIPSHYAYAKLQNAIDEGKHKLLHSSTENMVVIVEVKAIIVRDGKSARVEYV